MKALVHRHRAEQSRHGAILILAAAVLVVVLGLVAFAVDLGYIALAKAQLQAAADAAALGATLECNLMANQSLVDSAVKQGAVDVAALHRAGGYDAVLLDPAVDVQVGQASWNPTNRVFATQFGTELRPYNLVKVTARLKQFGVSSNGSTTIKDRRVPLFFARVFGRDYAEIEVSATAAVLPGAGFRVEAGTAKTANILPFALDLPTWLDLMNGIGPDVYTVNEQTGQISPGKDGIPEANLYPKGSRLLPPGNRGTVDLGGSNNSTNDVKRQILDGLNANDLSHFANNELRPDLGPLAINGDTGISSGFKAELAAIKGQPRAIPLFTQVQNPGNNAVFTIVKFVGIRIVDVKLTGSETTKYVTIQPSYFSDSTVIPGDGSILPLVPGAIMTAPMLIH